MKAEANDLTQKQMIRELYRGVIENHLLTRFATLESEHQKRGQNCPMLLAIQNGREARKDGEDAEDDFVFYRGAVEQQMGKLEDKISSTKIQVAGIIGGLTVLQGLIFWLIQRGG